jgi:hypothetical protein
VIDFHEIKGRTRQAFEQFISFIQNPWYNIRHLEILSAEQLTAYILVLSVVPVVLNFIFQFGFWGFLGIVTIPFRSIITVAMWLIMSYVIHMVAFREKEFDMLLVANLITFSGTFWFLVQVIPFLSPALGVFAYILFCEAYAPKIKEPRGRVYLAFGIGILVSIAPLLIAFRS